MNSLYAIGFVSALVMTQPDTSIEFDGERYVPRFHANQTDLRLVEYVRESETIDTWTKLFAIRNFPELNDPRATIRAFEATVKQNNPLAGVLALSKEDNSESMIDFLTWQPGDDTVEFNIHRYVRKPGYPGLVSYQFAYRFRPEPGDNGEELKKLRARWTEMMRSINPPVAFGE